MNHRAHIIAAVVVAVTCLSACGENQTPPHELDPYEPGDVDELECVPNLNGQIDADELRPAFGIPIDFRVSPAGEERAIDLAGFEDQEGNRVWDLREEFPTDQRLEVEATPIDDKWYADEYSSGEFTTVLDPAAGLDAVYSHDGDTFYLHGYASQQESPSRGQTLVVYEQPVAVYELPLQAGDRWGGVAEVHDGRVRGLPYSGEEIYEFEADAAGQLWLPHVRFEEVIRVHTKVTIDTPLGDPMYREQVQFLFECFGEVTRLVGPSVELNDDFSEGDYVFDTAVEMRRLSL